MCGRYRLLAGESNPRMQEIIDICNEDGYGRIDTDNSDEISPGDFAPALMLCNGKVQAASMCWGFTNPRGGLVINARSEDIHNRQMFRQPARENRCVLLSSGYYEWRRGDGQKYLISGEEVVYMAGLYRVEEDGCRRFVVLTRAAYGAHAEIHHRMPVILNTRQQARSWLFGFFSVSQAYAEENPDLLIEAQGSEQIRFDFDSFNE